jgi:hypothetical protein
MARAAARRITENGIGMNENLSKETRRRAGTWLAVPLLVALACDPTSNSRNAAKGDYGPDSMGVQPTAISIVPSHARRELSENSAAIMSLRQPGVFFTINDSGNDPVLFAMDTTGADRGAWRVRSATNVDWESGSMGPCNAASASPDCVYVGDTGDNMAAHRTRSVYRVHEPAARGQTDSVSAERLTYVYSDGPHDVEAMYVAPNGDLLFITKRMLKAASGAPRPALVFRIAPDAWASHDTVTAQIVDSLSIVPGSAPLRTITDASLAADAKHLAVRTYSQVFIFATDSLTGRVDHSATPSVCNVVVLGEAQGEGVTWVNNGGRLLFTSEGLSEPIRLANCPLGTK